MKLEALLMSAFLVALFIGIPPSPVVADNAVGVHELRLALLGHDVDGLWSRSRREEGSDFNAEVILTPGLNL